MPAAWPENLVDTSQRSRRPARNAPSTASESPYTPAVSTRLQPSSCARASADSDSARSTAPYDSPPMAHEPKPSSDTSSPVRPNCRYGIAPTLRVMRGAPMICGFVMSTPAPPASASAVPPPSSQRLSNVFIGPREPPLLRHREGRVPVSAHQETRPPVAQAVAGTRQRALHAPESAEHDAHGLHVQRP